MTCFVNYPESIKLFRIISEHTDINPYFLKLDFQGYRKTIKLYYRL